MVCECCLAIVIISNFVAICLETDQTATRIALNADDPVRMDELATLETLATINDVILCIYALELCIRIYTFGFSMFREKLTILDTLIIVVDVALALVNRIFGSPCPKVCVFRLFRLLRLRRVVHIFGWSSELVLLLRGISSALKATFWGSLLVFVVLIFWSIAGVQMINDINVELALTGYYTDIGLERGPRAFSSIGACLITFTQQIITGDSWGQVTIPIIEKQPLTAFYFLGVFISVGLLLMNLMLAVVVEKASEVQQCSTEEELANKQHERRQACSELMELCEVLDNDNSDCLNLAELTDGYDNSPGFAAKMQVMDVAKQDMEVIFSSMDVDGSGDVDFREFVEEMHKMKSSESYTLLVFLKFHINQIKKKLTEQLEVLGSSLAVDLQRHIEVRALSLRASASSHHVSDTIPEDGLVGPQVKTNVEDSGSATSTFDVNLLAAVNEKLFVVMQDISKKAEIHTKLLQTITSGLRRELAAEEQTKTPLVWPPPLPHEMQNQEIKQHSSQWSQRKARQGPQESKEQHCQNQQQKQQHQMVRERREPVDVVPRCLTASCCSIHPSDASTLAPMLADVPTSGPQPILRR
eukprot:TRINITY_DN8143_c0_g1_i2.p1 TRINITY_DN8143_c0_g1~~TRINITY_DN8143_c0_g1_i2.p1  ORF type:complete len:628 (+),score=107.29 TRINITY_DN8143_c0_g1_i2:127-1884(+)